MFVMYDSVDVSQIPNAPHAVAAYINGKYANYDEVVRRFPHARILRISVTGDVVADCYDLEKGDYPYSRAGELWKLAHSAGVWRPCLYFELSARWEVERALGATPDASPDARRWVAYYNGTTDIPSWADAHQFTDRALNRNLDESICRDTFFQPVKPPSDNVRRYAVSFDPDDGSASIAPLH